MSFLRQRCEVAGQTMWISWSKTGSNPVKLWTDVPPRRWRPHAAGAFFPSAPSETGWWWICSVHICPDFTVTVDGLDPHTVHRYATQSHECGSQGENEMIRWRKNREDEKLNTKGSKKNGTVQIQSYVYGSVCMCHVTATKDKVQMTDFSCKFLNLKLKKRKIIVFKLWKLGNEYLQHIFTYYKDTVICVISVLCCDLPHAEQQVSPHGGGVTTASVETVAIVCPPQGTSCFSLLFWDHKQLINIFFTNLCKTCWVNQWLWLKHDDESWTFLK